MAYEKIDPHLVQTAKDNGIKYQTYLRRVRVYGWDEVKAATHPVMTKKQAGREGGHGKWGTRHLKRKETRSEHV